MQYISYQDSLRIKSIAESMDDVVINTDARGLTSSMFTIHNALLLSACRFLEVKGIQPRLLEIGTYDGINSRILSDLMPGLRVTTFDLPPIDIRILAHNPSAVDKGILKQLYKDRIRNTSSERIRYIEASSTNISDYDIGAVNIIWVDGDHTFPQVAFDISASLGLVKNSHMSLLFCDDVYPTHADPTFQCLTTIEKDTDLQVTLFQKRSTGDKYVGLVYKNWPFLDLLD